MGLPNKIRDILLEERERWVLWAPVAVGLGVWLYCRLPMEMTASQAGRLLGIWFFGGWVIRRVRGLRTAWLAVFLAIAGLAAMAARTEMLAAPALERKINHAVVIGRIDEVEPRPEGVRLLLDEVVIDGLSPEKTPQRVRIAVKRPPQGLMSGQRVRIKAGLYPPPGRAMPGAFDFARHFYYQRIGAVGYSRSPPEVLEIVARDGWGERLTAFRNRLTHEVIAQVPGEEGAVAAALITGEQSAISEDVREDMRVSGLTHVLSISGLHLGLAAGIVFIAVRFALVLVPGLAIRFSVKKWAAALALAGAFGYLAVAGFPVAAQRSYAMVALFLAAILLDRVVTPMRSLAWAALLILLAQPEALLGASFRLSFAATIAIVAFYERFRDPLRRWFSHDSLPKRAAAYLLGVACTSLVAGLATAPFVIHDFNQFGAYNLPANLLASPVISFWIMPSAVLAFALMPLGLEGWALKAMGEGVGVMLGIAAWVRGLPGAFFHVPSLTGWGIALVTLGGLWLTLWRARWRMLGVPAVAAGLLSVFLYETPSVIVNGDAKQIAVLDAGGQWVMIRGGTRNFIAGQWLEQTGRQAYVKVEEARWSDEIGLRCDPLGCVYEAHGHAVEWAKTREAAHEDCGRMEALIAGFTVPETLCADAATQLIDGRALREHGAHALWMDKEGVRAEGANN